MVFLSNSIKSNLVELLPKMPWKLHSILLSFAVEIDEQHSNKVYWRTVLHRIGSIHWTEHPSCGLLSLETICIYVCFDFICTMRSYGKCDRIFIVDKSFQLWEICLAWLAFFVGRVHSVMSLKCLLLITYPFIILIP